MSAAPEIADKLKLLVADDEERIRYGLNRTLSARGYDVVTAENGRAALEVLQTEPVDVILLDLKMPVMSGERVLEVVHAEHPEIVVIVITGHGSIDSAVECMKKGAYDFITKPYDLAQLLIIVNRAADKRRLERTSRRLHQENARNLYDLALEKGRTRSIIQRLANGVLVTNLNLEVVLHNPALERMMDRLDLPEAPIPLSEIIRDESLLETIERLQSGTGPADEVASREISVRDKTLRAISLPALGPDGERVGVITVIEDITVFKQMNQMKSDLVSMVAHELRSPLVSIKQLLNVLLEDMYGPLGDKQRDYLSRAGKKIDAMMELIRDLLDLARIEAGIVVQNLEPIDLEPIVRTSLELLEARARKQNVTLECRVQGPQRVLADAGDMEKVFNNLIDNAIKYSPDGGRVSVRVLGSEESVEVLVSDRGIGIEAGELPKIFNKYYRVKHPRTRTVIGTGLGLSMVKSIIEAHQGSIGVESVPDQGTTFRITLPAMKNGP